MKSNYKKGTSAKLVFKDLWNTTADKHNFKFKISQIITYVSFMVQGTNKVFDPIRTKYFKETVEIENDVGSFQVNLSDQTMNLSSLYYEYYLDDWFKNDNGKQFFIDVGANIGFHTVKHHKPYEQVVCLEPCKETFRLLKKNIALNSLQKKCDLVMLGLGKESKTVKFKQYVNSPGISHVLEENEDKNRNYGDYPYVISQVRVITFDEFLEDRKIPINQVSLVKIDIEGYEYNALMGMKKFLKESSIGCKIIIEVWNSEVHRNKVFKILNRRGFILQEKFGDKDCLFVKESM